ncbi:MAG: TolC family protein [bacterium]|nr:TolC family protein [bacterium]
MRPLAIHTWLQVSKCLRRFCGSVLAAACLVTGTRIPAETASRPPAAAKAPAGADRPTSTAAPRLNAQSIIQATFENNADVTAARHQLEEKEYAFKEFERNLSQFTPLMARTSAGRELRHDLSLPGHSHRLTQHDYQAQMGMQKEFFDGSSIFLGIGHRGLDGDVGNGASNYVLTDLRFPLFSSNTTLTRITQRTYQENEMYDARLEYVDAIRQAINEAQCTYYWLLADLAIVEDIKQSIAAYKELLGTPNVARNEAEKRQIEDQLKSLQSDLIRYDGYVAWQLVSLQSDIGFESLPLERIDRIDLARIDEHAHAYLNASIESLAEEADLNDIEIQVLQNAMTNAVEKKRLAQKGKWDTFLDLHGQADVGGREDMEAVDGYRVSVGLSVKLIDSNLRSLTIKKSEAEIEKYRARISGRKLETHLEIDRAWADARSHYNQFVSIQENLATRRAVFDQKRQAYLDGTDTIDNVILARKNLLESQNDLMEILGNFHRIISDLDTSCGYFYKKLGISIEPARMTTE